MHSTLIALLLAIAFGPVARAAENSDPTPRKGIDPADAAKVKQFEAKRWLGFGASSRVAQAPQVETTVSGTIPGRRNCTTRIGASAPSGIGPAGRPIASPRFGQTRDNVLIVTGSVINVCR